MPSNGAGATAFPCPKPHPLPLKTGRLLDGKRGQGPSSCRQHPREVNERHGASCRRRCGRPHARRSASCILWGLKHPHRQLPRQLDLPLRARYRFQAAPAGRGEAAPGAQVRHPQPKACGAHPLSCSGPPKRRAPQAPRLAALRAPLRSASATAKSKTCGPNPPCHSPGRAAAVALRGCNRVVFAPGWLISPGARLGSISPLKLAGRLPPARFPFGCRRHSSAPRPAARVHRQQSQSAARPQP